MYIFRFILVYKWIKVNEDNGRIILKKKKKKIFIFMFVRRLGDSLDDFFGFF